MQKEKHLFSRGTEKWASFVCRKLSKDKIFYKPPTCNSCILAEGPWRPYAGPTCSKCLSPRCAVRTLLVFFSGEAAQRGRISGQDVRHIGTMQPEWARCETNKNKPTLTWNKLIIGNLQPEWARWEEEKNNQTNTLIKPIMRMCATLATCTQSRQGEKQTNSTNKQKQTNNYMTQNK